MQSYFGANKTKKTAKPGGQTQPKEKKGPPISCYLEASREKKERKKEAL